MSQDILDYSEADFDQLSEQWEQNDDEKLPPDELPYGHPDRSTNLTVILTGQPICQTDLSLTT